MKLGKVWGTTELLLRTPFIEVAPADDQGERTLLHALPGPHSRGSGAQVRA